MFHWHWPVILKRFCDIKPKYIWVATLTFLGHVTSSVTWPFDSLYTISYKCSFGTDALSQTGSNVLGVTTLTFLGHMTSSVTSALDSHYVISYRCSIDTELLSWSVFVILSLNVSGSRQWPFWVTWRNRSRDHSIPCIRFPVSDPLQLTLYLKRAQMYWVSRPWPFWVTWRHRWRHHWTPTMWFPIGVPLTLTRYLEAFLWY